MTMRKTLALLLALVFCATLLTGCGAAANNVASDIKTKVTATPAPATPTAAPTEAPTETPEATPDDSTEPAGADRDPRGTDKDPRFPGVPYTQEGFMGTWRCTLEEANYAPEIFSYLRITEDGRVAFDYGTGYGPAGMGMVMYRGTWRVDPDLGPSNLPDPIILDMSLDTMMFHHDEESFPRKKNSIFSFFVEDDHLFLSYLTGDILYKSEGPPMWDYAFVREDTQDEELNFWKMSDSELTEYMGLILFVHFGLFNAEVFYPLELNKWEGNEALFGFVYHDGETYKYAWLNATTGEVTFADEVENYTGED